MPHCVHLDNEPCEVTVHAEANVIAYAARHGIPALGADLVTTHSPCLACAKLIINAGISRVVYSWEYRIKEPIDLLRSAGVACETPEAI
jgi:dCMP deaminase